MAPLHIHHRGRINAPLASFMRPWFRLCAVAYCCQGAMNGAPTGRAVPVIRALLMALLHIHHRGRIHAPLASFMRPWLIIARAPSMAPLQIYIRAR